jgi:hypothetical protein
MRPDQLRVQDFDQYLPFAREFAIQYLPLLQRLPPSICPSFLVQIQRLDTSFPAERASLRQQCEFLLHMSPAKFAEIVAPFVRIRLSSDLKDSDWIRAPASFVTGLTAYLWSSGQIDQFRAASTSFFASIPEPNIHPHRLTFVILGQGAGIPPTLIFQKLRRKGVMLTALTHQDMSQQVFRAFRQHAAFSTEPYAHWYVDGGERWMEDYPSLPGAVCITYPKLSPLRERVLVSMEKVVSSVNANAEEMRTRLTSIHAEQLNAAEITSDPVLQRFYTELFTESSGPQIFSTSFVQWAGRELARRAQPQTLLLRYAPRQSYRAFEELLRNANPQSLDPEGSLRDADMGAWYTWIEMNRITAPGKGTFVAWFENSPQAVLISPNAPAASQCSSPLSLEEALSTFG